jgi:hypothetical protein
MKRGVILAAAALSMTCATGVHLLTTPYRGAPVGPPPTAVMPIQKASLDIRQTPVPLQLKPHPAVNPTVDAREAHAKSEAAPVQTFASGSAASTANDLSSENAAPFAVEAGRSATSRGTVRIFVDDQPRAPDRRSAGGEPDATTASAVRAAELWRAGYTVQIVLSKAAAKTP